MVKSTTAPGKVKGKSFFSRHIKQFASGFKRQPGTARGCSHVGNAPTHIFSQRQLSREIAHHINHHLLKLQLRGIHTIEITPGSEYEFGVAGTKVGNIEVCKCGNLRGRALIEIVHPHIEAHVRVLIREEENLVIKPERLGINGRAVGNVDRAVVSQIVEVNIRRETAAIAFEGPILRQPGDIGDAIAICREARHFAVRHVQQLRQAALLINKEQTPHPLSAAGTGRSK